MGVPGEPDKGVLIAGILVGDEALLPEVREALARALGALDRVSEVWPFDTTDYYADELGADVRRQFVSFAAPFALDRLAEVKLTTNALECDFAQRMNRGHDRRPVNLDPGYLTLAALVLATTKPRAHRIYLGRGIHAEVTLNFEGGRWRAWPWTYPDYAADRYHGFITQLRDDLKRRRKGETGPFSAQLHTPPDSG
jgi:hypothetical protein